MFLILKITLILTIGIQIVTDGFFLIVIYLQKAFKVLDIHMIGMGKRAIGDAPLQKWKNMKKIIGFIILPTELRDINSI